MPEVDIEIEQDIFLSCYHHLIDDNDIDIDFIYGSRDSGKSRDEAMRLVKKCLEATYFRHILARKTFNTIKDSQWQLIRDVIDEWGLYKFFEFTKNPLEINCVNGNKFLCRGFDDPHKIKSIQNPSGAWVEEGNELTKDDWVILLTSLRTNTGKTKVDVTFNPEADGDYRDFWLYKDYFDNHPESFISEKETTINGITHTVRYRATHTTYNNNPYCSPQRKAIYEDLKITSPYHYRIYGLGKWGNRENKSPFILTFNRQQHLGTTTLDRSKIVYLSFDFNRNPMCCSVVQWDNYKKVDWLEVIKLHNSTIYQMCDYIKAAYADCLFIVCGDGSGSSQSGAIREFDLNSYYKVIKQELNLLDTQLQYVVNPSIAENQVLVNHCFKNLDVTINNDTCQPLIFDLEFAEIRSDGTLEKGDRNNPKQQLDALDTCRYFFNRYFSNLIKL